jgi:diguanylate cyclase
MLGHRHRLFGDVERLCQELSQGLTEVAEDESWARGQAEQLQQRLAGGLTARSVRSATELLAETRSRQQRVRSERQAASRALKDLIQRLLGEIGELGEHTGRFGDSLEKHSQSIAAADSLESLADVVRALLDESHAVQALVRGTQQRMQADHARASELEAKVRALEGELRRLSDEVSTDALTQVANRRGLQQAFEAESARAGREAQALAVGLIDIDNFKKLNDSLGHAAGDVALKSLAAAVKERLRPLDTVARFGGEEFVVLLPGLPADEAQQVLTRLQRSLSASLFMHDGREVFVTFSGGVTAWRPGEAIEAALERADEALYEAKRTGKNRTCCA